MEEGKVKSKKSGHAGTGRRYGKYILCCLALAAVTAAVLLAPGYIFKAYDNGTVGTSVYSMAQVQPAQQSSTQNKLLLLTSDGCSALQLQSQIDSQQAAELFSQVFADFFVKAAQELNLSGFDVDSLLKSNFSAAQADVQQSYCYGFVDGEPVGVNLLDISVSDAYSSAYANFLIDSDTHMLYSFHVYLASEGYWGWSSDLFDLFMKDCDRVFRSYWGIDNDAAVYLNKEYGVVDYAGYFYCSCRINSFLYGYDW